MRGHDVAKPTKETPRAVALKFRPREDSAPQVLAKGSGFVADKIIELARKHYLPVRQDRGLVQVLSLLDLHEEIPPHIYRAVAEILAFVYRVSNPDLNGRD
jgi:flagellar biosynthesis protein